MEGRDLPVIFQTFSALLAKQESKVSLPEMKKGKDLLCLADEDVAQYPMAGAFNSKRTGDTKGDILGPALDLYASREA